MYLGTFEVEHVKVICGPWYAFLKIFLITRKWLIIGQKGYKSGGVLGIHMGVFYQEHATVT